MTARFGCHQRLCYLLRPSAEEAAPRPRTSDAPLPRDRALHESPPVCAAPRPRSLRTTNEPPALREPPSPHAGLEHEMSASSGHLLSVKLLVLQQGWAPRIRDGLHASLRPAPVRPSCVRPRRQPRKNHARLLFVGPPRDRGLTPCARCNPLPEKMPLTDVCNQHSSRAPYEQLDSLAPLPARKPCSLARTKPSNEPRARVRLRLTAVPQLQPSHDRRSPLLG